MHGGAQKSFGNVGSHAKSKRSSCCAVGSIMQSCPLHMDVSFLFVHFHGRTDGDVDAKTFLSQPVGHFGAKGGSHRESLVGSCRLESTLLHSNQQPTNQFMSLKGTN